MKWLFALLLAGFAVFSAAAQGATYPTRSVKVIVPFAPGGPTDVLARIVCQALSDQLGQTFYIENHAGGASNSGIMMAAGAQNDGYTILISSDPIIFNPAIFARPMFDPTKDFEAISFIATTPNLLVATKDAPFNTLAELKAYAKDHPVSYAHPGVGTSSFFSGEVMKSKENIMMIGIPFAGSGPAAQALLSNTTQLGLIAATPLIQMIKDGLIKGLAVSDPQRMVDLPDVPTFAEFGLKDQVSYNVLFAVAPKGTPSPIVDLLNSEINKALLTDQVKKRFADLSFVSQGGTPDQAKAYMQTSIDHWKSVVQELGFTKIP